MEDKANATDFLEATVVTAEERAAAEAAALAALAVLEAASIEFENARNALGTAQLAGSPKEFLKAELRLSVAAQADFASQRAIDIAAQAVIDARDGKVT